VERGRLPAFHALPDLPRIRFHDLAIWYENEKEKIPTKHRARREIINCMLPPLLKYQQTFANLCVQHAFKIGLLKREPCTYCGAEPADAHHPDYSKPLWVIWMCPFHHSRHHGLVNAAGRNSNLPK
jgi:hypothetical protein